MIKNIVKSIAALGALVGFSISSAYAMPVNFAESGTASQSSTWSGNLAASVASNAIDGNTNGVWNFGNAAANSLNHTNKENGAWWQVDLGQAINIDEIVIWNRTDCCIARANNFNVLIDGNVIHTYNQPNGPTPTLTLSNLNLSGQIIRVQLNDNDYLHLAEVQVFGTSKTTTPQVSEPAPMALLGFGLIGMALYRKKRK